MTSVLLLNCLVGPVVKASGSRAADPAEVLQEGLNDLNKTFFKVHLEAITSNSVEGHQQKM